MGYVSQEVWQMNIICLRVNLEHDQTSLTR